MSFSIVWNLRDIDVWEEEEEEYGSKCDIGEPMLGFYHHFFYGANEIGMIPAGLERKQAVSGK